VYAEGHDPMRFSDRFERDGMKFTEPSINFFSFNNPYGACRTCEGFGKVLGIDEDLVIPDKTLSVYEGAIAPWRSEVMGEWLTPLLKNGIKFGFPIHRPYNELTPADGQAMNISTESTSSSNTSKESRTRFNTALCFRGTAEGPIVRTAEERDFARMRSMSRLGDCLSPTSY
jgi:excinuclease UvrABC ATPase subunit